MRQLTGSLAPLLVAAIVPCLACRPRVDSPSARAPGPAPAAPVTPAAAATPHSAASKLVDLLGGGDERLALDAAGRLERLGSEAIPALERALREGPPLRRFRAARVLSLIGEPAVPALAGTLANGDGAARYLAAEALARMGPAARAAREPLRAALGDGSRSVGHAAARALASQGEEGIAVLEEALGSGDEGVRSLAALALPGKAVPETLPQQDSVGSSDLLADVTDERGISFQNVNGASGRRFMVETVGFGGGWLDYDRDGFLDLYLVQGNGHPEKALDGPAGPDEPGDVLLRNVDGKRFEDVSERAGITGRGYGMGLAAGDYDRDGYPDLFVTGYGGTTLLHNSGNGTFSDVTESARASIPGWSTSAAWADFDGDGHLDLYVVRYVEYDIRTHPGCTAIVPGTGRRVPAYCDPVPFEGAHDILLRAVGDGTFRDVSRESGIASSRGRIEDKGLGVVVSDFDGDSDPDILVANDKSPNTLWRNLGAMRFENAALDVGFAFSADGVPKAGMGIADGDVDGDGRIDYLVTNFSGETYTLFLGRPGYFEDATGRSGLAVPTFLPLGFGACFLDLDLDGDLDLYTASGHVLDNVRLVRPDSGVGFGQPDLLLENDGKGRFQDASARGGAWFRKELVGRAVARADHDNDGDADLLVTNVAGPAVLLENRAGDGRSWIGFQLESPPPGPVVETARVEVEVGGRTIVREAQAGGSYLSAHDPRISIGLEGIPGPVQVRVRWPGQTVFQSQGQLERGRYHVIRPGK